MRVTSHSELGRPLAATIETVNADHEPERLHNAKRLIEAIKRLDQGEGAEHDLLEFDEQAWADHLHWQATSAGTLSRLNVLIHECTRTPFAGTGKPEPGPSGRIVVAAGDARASFGVPRR